MSCSLSIHHSDYICFLASGLLCFSATFVAHTPRPQHGSLQLLWDSSKVMVPPTNRDDVSSPGSSGYLRAAEF
ncbi:hypothetical protein ATANTOWER_029505 [Ataeniobius toweri]|uniref:Secreted protein n=1 Tax=Ataeniobius toweri TaxID=208326 RepID=A0ABU7BCA1_9TELE|nr:hypothetical protein [Ataeniobius toweri]